MSSMDIATEQNLNELVKVGEALLKKPVSTVNLETGVYEPSHAVTNEEALRRFVTDMIKKLIRMRRQLLYNQKPIKMFDIIIN